MKEGQETIIWDKFSIVQTISSEELKDKEFIPEFKKSEKKKKSGISRSE